MFISHAGSGTRSGSTDASGFFISGTAGSAGSGPVGRRAAGADRENSWYTGTSASERGLPAADAVEVTVGCGEGIPVAVADGDAVGEVVGGGGGGGGSLMAVTFTFRL